MMNRRQAMSALEYFEGLAARDQTFTRTLGQSTFSVISRDGSFEYIWGPNPVPKAIAISVLESFAD